MDITAVRAEIGGLITGRQVCTSIPGEPQVPGRAEIHNPAGEDALVDEVALHRRQAFAVEGLGAETAQPVRVFHKRDVIAENRLAQRILEEAGAPRD